MKKLSAGSIFSQSRELKKIIGRHGFDLYDISRPKERERRLSWDELEKIGPDEVFVVDRTYLFAPRPRTGETLRDACIRAHDLSPSLQIADVFDARWVALEPRRTLHLVLFARLVFAPSAVIGMTPESVRPNPDLVGVGYDYVIDTFKRFFSIVDSNDRRAAMEAVKVVKDINLSVVGWNSETFFPARN